MAWPTDQVATGDLITAAQLNRLCTQLANETLAGADADFDFTSIPAHWSHLFLLVDGRGTTAAQEVNVVMRFNNDSAGNYDFEQLEGRDAVVASGASTGQTSGRVGKIPAASAAADRAGSVVIWIPNYAGTTFEKSWISHWVSINSEFVTGQEGGSWFAAVGAINRVTLLPAAGNFAAGSRATLYGMGRI